MSIAVSSDNENKIKQGRKRVSIVYSEDEIERKLLTVIRYTRVFVYPQVFCFQRNEENCHD
jgi:hypothetical protein